MPSLFMPRLINDPFGDPGLFVRFRYERRAFLFDLGDLQPLAPRDLLSISHIFVSHMHMDHFSGFDRVLRLFLGREKDLNIFGPTGIIESIAHKLAAYTWDRVENYPSDFTITVNEWKPPGHLKIAKFSCKSQFRLKTNHNVDIADGLILDEPTLLITTVELDHGIPCLAFALQEKAHVNVWKNQVERMGFRVGPWLTELKEAIVSGKQDDEEFRVWWQEHGTIMERLMPLGDLKRNIVSITPGQKFTYVVDASFTKDNIEKIIELANNSEILFIEAPFLHADAEHASERNHLTAHQAGQLGRMAGAKRVVPFHFSPRYAGSGDRLAKEVHEIFTDDS